MTQPTIEQIREAVERSRSANVLEAFDGRGILKTMGPSLAHMVLDLTAERDAGLKREADANKRAMKHLRDLESCRTASANHASFSHEWRQRSDKAEAERDALKAKLDEAVDLLARSREELRLIRVKDTDAVYDVMLGMEIKILLAKLHGGDA